MSQTTLRFAHLILHVMQADNGYYQEDATYVWHDKRSRWEKSYVLSLPARGDKTKHLKD